MDVAILVTKLDKICRVCLKVCDKDVNSRSVFGELNDQEIDDNLFFVYEILCTVTAIEVNKGDGYPTLVCAKCMTEANVAYKFKRAYEQSNAIITQCLKQRSKDINGTNETSKQDEIDEIQTSAKENCSQENNRNLCRSNSVSQMKLDPCITTDIFNLSEIEAENVNIETIFDNLNQNSELSEGEEKPKIKNISMMNENKIARRCSSCKYIFQTAYAYNNHSCNRDDLDRKLCPICGKSISKSHFNKHLYMHSGRRDYICKICNKAYNASGSLKFHMAKHTGEKPYLCSLCGKRFIQPTALKYHMRFHNNERRYKCSYCEKSFVMQCHLVAHERVHTGLKPFICEICKKGFTRKVELKAHTYSHSGDKPYKCSFCDKTFTRKTHLTLHEMIHSGRRPHECKICGKGFIQKQPLLMHLRIHVQEDYTPNEENQEQDDYSVNERVNQNEERYGEEDEDNQNEEYINVEYKEGLQDFL